MSSNTEFKNLGIAGLVIYGSLACVVLSSFIWRRLFKQTKLQKGALNIQRMFRAILLCFLISRIIWLVLLLEGMKEEIMSFVTNRLSFGFFFSAYTLVLFYWAETYHQNYYDSSRFMPLLGSLFIVVNFAFWIFQMVLILLFIIYDSSKEGNPFYELNIITDVVLSLILAVGFTFYGFRLLYRRMNTEGAWEALLMTLLTLVFFLCFMVRVLMFAYRPVTGKYFPETIFYLFGYYLTETIPTAVQLYIVQTTRTKEENLKKFIDDLYANEDTYGPTESSTLLGNMKTGV
eukprot:TRINITY_DN11897_c0_g1_i1.p1 TRINITY_DN11897_c0_g1~~TRINITY_DN11897_c0_g1_i1.p1  ORF type:complete len:289 (+),score=18.26 TRINITY_DN11897_c0_g1_i1:59-925(+)